MVNIPQASNNLNSLGTFNNRQLYTNQSYPTGSNIAVPIDMWYEKPLYGKLNLNNDPVFLSEVFLKQLDVDPNIFSLNFVVDAFKDLKIFFQNAKNRNKINTTNSILQSLTPKSSWVNMNALYSSYMNMLFEIFNETFVNGTDRKNKLTDFDSYIEIFIEFIDSLTPNYPLSRTNFINSKYCDAAMTGIMIELNIENHDLDQNKYQKYIQDPNFKFYTKAARQFGFSVDKNAPWRLVADLASVSLKKYLTQNKISLDTLFDTFYYESSLLDLNVLKVYIIQFYNSYVDLNPFNNITSFNSSGNLVFEKFKRTKVSENNISSKYDYNFWLKILTYIRARELDVDMTQFQFDTTVQVAQDANKYIDNETALRYINRKFRGTPLTGFDIQTTEADLKLEASETLLRPKFRTFKFF